MRFKVIVATYNAGPWIERCLTSIATQSDPLYDVCVVDDASTDGQDAIVRRWCEDHQWEYILNTEHHGTMYNQIMAIKHLAPNPEDVIVIVDGDDRLAHEHVLKRVRRHYDEGIDLTYGSYVSEPYAVTCQPAVPYPPHVVAAGNYRQYMRTGGGIFLNHLRTLRYKLIRDLPDSEWQDATGEWYKTCADAAMMLPALERCHGNYKVLPEVLYIYNSENPISEWRKDQAQIAQDYAHIFSRTPRG